MGLVDRSVSKKYDFRSFMKMPVIEVWRADLLDEDNEGVAFADFLIFNIEYQCVRADTEEFKLMGDAAMWLLFRDLETGDPRQFYLKIQNQPSADIIHKLTGIPYTDCEKLLTPKHLWDIDFPTEELSPRSFVAVLDHYLKYGDVNWAVAHDAHLLEQAEKAEKAAKSAARQKRFLKALTGPACPTNDAPSTESSPAI